MTDRVPQRDDIMIGRKRLFNFLIIHDIATGTGDFFLFVLGAEPYNFEMIIASGEAAFAGTFIGFYIFF